MDDASYFAEPTYLTAQEFARAYAQYQSRLVEGSGTSANPTSGEMRELGSSYISPFEKGRAIYNGLLETFRTGGIIQLLTEEEYTTNLLHQTLQDEKQANLLMQLLSLDEKKVWFPQGGVYCLGFSVCLLLCGSGG